MALVPTQNTSTSSLVAGIIGTVDIGSLVAQSLTLQMDIDRATTKLNTIKAALQASFNRGNAEAIALASGNGEAVVNAARNGLFQDTEALYIMARDQAIQSAAGFRISSLMLGLEAKLYTTINHVDLESKAMIDIPESIALLKVQRYYNKLLAPYHPQERDLIIMRANAWKNSSDVLEHFQSDQGLNASDAQALLDIRVWQSGKPSLYDAWIMAKKGLMPINNFYNIAKIGLGWTDADAKALYQHFFYTFSPMEIFRISDLVSLPVSWITKKLSMVGLNDEDSLLVTNMILARTIKTEVGQAWNIILDNYSWGLQTKADLTQFCMNANMPKVEMDAKLIVADLLREKVVLKLMRDAEIYLYRKDVANENQLLTNLQSLNIDLSVANAITRNEAAKKGVEWELPP